MLISFSTQKHSLNYIFDLECGLLNVLHQFLDHRSSLGVLENEMSIVLHWPMQEPSRVMDLDTKVIEAFFLFRLYAICSPLLLKSISIVHMC